MSENLLNPSIEEQWLAVLTMIKAATDDDRLGYIAAGPLEDLFSKYGEQIIDRVEQEAAMNRQFARTLTNVWQWGMSDQLYARIRAACAIARLEEPLKLMKISQGEIDRLVHGLSTMMDNLRYLSSEHQAGRLNTSSHSNAETNDSNPGR